MPASSLEFSLIGRGHAAFRRTGVNQKQLLQRKESVMKTLIAFFVMAALTAPVVARSADGFIVADVALQSGPDYDYPPVDQLAAGTPVVIEGCVEGWIWCDVSIGDLRGWVPGTYIEQNYEGRWVYIVDYGPRIGLPVVVFSLNTYWGAHYHDRPWFAERERWASRSIHPRAPARLPGEAHAPPQRPGRPAAPMTNTPGHPPATPQTNPNNTTRTDRSIEPDQLRRATPPASGGMRIPNSPERTTPTEPAVEPARRPQASMPKSAPPQQQSQPQSKPEAKPKPEARPKPKAEPKEPAKKENPERREENNGHDAGTVGAQRAPAERSVLGATNS
jgi:uncharacterized protein YraI